jgi:4-hydroxy-tetrahydrodipicolinate reductase
MTTPLIVCGAAGRMGRALTVLIAAQPETALVGAVEAPVSPAVGRDAGDVAGVGSLGVVIGTDLAAVARPDTVILDFTNAEAALHHLRIAVAAGSAMVIGSTGFDAAQETELGALAPRIRCVVESNMSVGIAVLRRLIREAAPALGPEFDPEVVEIHHRMKIDAPSGTALTLAREIAQATGRDARQDIVCGRQGLIGSRPPRNIGVMALRGGDVVGDHTIVFAGLGERLELTHRAHSRDCLARGALRAACWVVSQPPGRYGMADVLGWQ